MQKLQEMARQGKISKKLAKCRIPTCSACLYSKATKRPWRGKESKKGRPTKTLTRPGQVVSVDQLVSPTPGLIAQMTGFLTTKRYKYETVHVDQYTRYGYVYLQKTASAEESVEGKKAFETMSRRRGVRIENYHADNGIFKAYKWIEACKEEKQGITFAGVNAHHQNGVAERRIRELQELAARESDADPRKLPLERQRHSEPVAVRSEDGKRCRQSHAELPGRREKDPSGNVFGVKSVQQPKALETIRLSSIRPG